MEFMPNLDVKGPSFYLSVCYTILGLLTVAFCQSVPHYSKDGQQGQPGLVKVVKDTLDGWICAQDYDERDAVVICRSLNLPHTDARPLKEVSHRQQENNIILQRLDCHGNETSLEQCPGVEWQYVKCPLKQLVKVRCSSATEGKLRLMSGSVESIGRVEYFHQGVWMTVHGMDSGAAVVLCRSLGFPHEMARIVYGFQDKFQYQIRAAWIKEVRCEGTEPSWENCIVVYYRIPSRVSFRDMHVSCEGLRLRGHESHSGVLEGYFEDKWRNVYSPEFNSVEASVACKVLKLPRSAAEVVRRDKFVTGQNVMTCLDVGTCEGSESKLTDCYLSRWVFKECGEVTIACKHVDMTDVKFRLTGGHSSSAGYLQVFYRGLWAHICGQGTDSAVATVACRTLGQSRFGGAVIPTKFIGSGSSNIVMNGVQCTGEETDLAQCYFNPWGVGWCPSWKALTIYCGSLENTFDVRLKDGGSYNFGRVEMYAYGTWYRVCKSDQFNVEDARVVCNQLQLPKANAKVTSCFDNGTNAIWPSFVHCDGDEDHLNNCTGQEIPPERCKVLKIICSDEEISDQDCFNILPGWAIATLVLAILLGLLVAVCVFMKVRRNKEAHPVDNTRPQLYLVGEGGENFELNIPPPIMDTPHPAYDAPHPAYDAELPAYDAEPPAYDAEPPAYDAEPPAYDAEPPAYDAELPAYDTLFKFLSWLIQVYFLVVLPVQTQGQTFSLWRGGPRDGLLRLNYEGEDSVICSKSPAFTWREASVLCRGMSLQSLHPVITPYESYLAENETFLEFKALSIDFQCTGKETSFVKCVNFTTIGTPKNETCFRGIGVLCTSAVPEYRLLDDRRLRVRIDSTWSTVCADGLTVEDAVVACRTLQKPWSDSRPLRLIKSNTTRWKLNDLRCTGSEESLKDCSSVIWGDTECKGGRDVGVLCAAASELKFRLINGSSLAIGRLEVFNKGRWGTVCNKGGFGREAASVVCKSLGYEYKNARAVPNTHFGTGSGVIWMANVSCEGSESSLMDCSKHFDGKPITMTCSHSDDVAVSCESYRLDKHGGLQLSYESRWIDVYNGSFNIKAATVACRALGLPRSGAKFNSREVSVGPGEILEVSSCRGSEDTFFNCRHQWVDPEELRAKNISVGGVQLTCEPADTKNIKFRHPGEDMMGLYEVYNGSHWGTICGNGLGVVEARVACQSLGLGSTFAARLPTAYIQKGNGSVLMDGVSCKGQESSLAQCDHNPMGLITCDPDNRDDLNIYCGKPEDNYKVRLAGGSQKAGRVEVKMFGVWGTVCADGFNSNAAKVVCRQLNVPISEPRTVSIFPEGQGQIWLHRVNCTGEETDIRDCQHGPLVGATDCTHGDDIGVVCSGTVVEPASGISGGAIAGIVIAVLIIFAILIVVLCVGIRRWSAARRDLRSNLLKTSSQRPNSGTGSEGSVEYNHGNGMVNMGYNESPNASKARAAGPMGYAAGPTSKPYNYDSDQGYRKGMDYRHEENLSPPAYHTLGQTGQPVERYGDDRSGYSNFTPNHRAPQPSNVPSVSRNITWPEGRSPSDTTTLPG
ncbi:scavenger receptor cysteine-rich type 1 protein M130-like [Liolophura sinensis]|uniref:scavenger receptor cysteine-rich type 1 protein M130-like n=1 Tax=Liolophura sinensis TaxID=3198878 RepID=UPI00315901C1